eukprot:sb/3465798/
MGCFVRGIYNAPARVSRSIITGPLTPVGCMEVCGVYKNCSNVAFNLATSECTLFECTLYHIPYRPQPLSRNTSPLYMSAAKDCVEITDNFQTMTMEELVGLTQTLPCVFRKAGERHNDDGFRKFSCLKRHGVNGVKWGECSLVMDTWRLENHGNYTAYWVENDIPGHMKVRVSLNNELCLTHLPKEEITSDRNTGVHLEPCCPDIDPRQLFLVNKYELHWGTELIIEGAEHEDLYFANTEHFNQSEHDISSVKLYGYFIPSHTIPCSTKISKKYGVLESEVHGIPTGVSAIQECPGGGERREVRCENRTLVGLIKCEGGDKVMPSEMTEVRAFVLYILYGISAAFVVFVVGCAVLFTPKGYCNPADEDGDN